MQKPAKGGPIPRFAHDKRDPWGRDSWHLVPKAYLTAGGVTEACSPRRCTKGSRPPGTKLRVVWFRHVSGRCRTTCITCRLTSALKRRKVTFRRRRRETTTENTLALPGKTDLAYKVFWFSNMVAAGRGRHRAVPGVHIMSVFLLLRITVLLNSKLRWEWRMAKW